MKADELPTPICDAQRDPRMAQLVASPCCFPDWSLEDTLAAAARIGFTRFEIFTEWTGSRLDLSDDVDAFAAALSRHGLRASSMHLPTLRAEDPEGSLGRAVDAMRIAARLGVPIALYKGKDRESMIDLAPRFLDGTDGLGVTPVIQNHKGSAVSSLDDVRAVIDSVNDPRLKVLLEVGHFLAVGTHWREALPALQQHIAYVHVKDLRDGESVLYGEGDADLPGLFEAMRQRGYDGGYVVEIEGALREENVEANLARCVQYLKDHCVQPV